MDNCSTISWGVQITYRWHDDDEDDDRFVLTNTLSWISWNNSPCITMPLHWDTLFWFRGNQSFLLLLNAACLGEKQHILIQCLWFYPTEVQTYDLPRSRWAQWILVVSWLLDGKIESVIKLKHLIVADKSKYLPKLMTVWLKLQLY